VPHVSLLPLIADWGPRFTGDSGCEVISDGLALAFARLQKVGCCFHSSLLVVKGSSFPNDITKNFRWINNECSSNFENQLQRAASMPSLRKVTSDRTWAPSAYASIGGSIWRAMTERVVHAICRLSKHGRNDSLRLCGSCYLIESYKGSAAVSISLAPFRDPEERSP